MIDGNGGNDIFFGIELINGFGGNGLGMDSFVGGLFLDIVMFMYLIFLVGFLISVFGMVLYLY